MKDQGRRSALDREGRAPKRAQVPAFGVRPPLERPRGQHSALPRGMVAASCFSRISIRFRGPVLSTQALKWSRPAMSESGGERFGLARILRLVRATSGTLEPRYVLST